MPDNVPATELASETAIIASLKSQYFTLINQVTTPAISIVVSSPEEYLAADARLPCIQSTKKKIVAELEEEIRPRYETLEAWYALKRELLDPLDTAEKSLKSKMTAFKLEEANRVWEAQRLLDEETKRLSQQAQVEVAKSNDTNLSAVGRARAKFKAKTVVEQAKEVAVVSAPPPPVKGKSSTFIPTETWQIVDRKLFLQAIIDGIIPEECIMVQAVNMNMWWKMNKEKVKAWPGVGVMEGGRVAGR